MSATRTRTKLAQEATRAFGDRPHVVGIARGANDSVTIMLDQDDANLREDVRQWASRRRSVVTVRVVGALALS